MFKNKYAGHWKTEKGSTVRIDYSKEFDEYYFTFYGTDIDFIVNKETELLFWIRIYGMVLA